MTATTTQAALKKALYYALQSNPNISWGITYGDPMEGAVSREAVYIGAARSEDSEQEPASFRRGSRNEEYTITVFADTSGELDPVASEEKAVAVAGEIESTVIEDPTLGVDGVLWVGPAGVDLQTTPTTEGFRTTAKVRLAVKGQLRWP
jgi:hypothetical protein